MTTPSFVAPVSNSAPRKTLPAGNFPARCYQMIYMGTHDEEFQGEKKTLRKIWLGWEFPTRLDVFQEGKEPEPYTMGKEFTFSMHEKASFRQALESWRGRKFSDEQARSFDSGKLLGVPCLINVQTYAKKSGEDGVKVGSITPMIDGITIPTAMNPVLAFSITDPDWSVFEKLPQFLQEKIKKSQEYIAIARPQPTQAESDQSLVENLFNKEDADAPVPF